MDPLHAAILGALQGLTEVLPISSSAHLILVPRFLGWPESGLTFDVALHVGTLLALLVYFRSDIVALVGSFVRVVTGKGDGADRLPLYLIAGTVPAAVVGKLLEDPIEELFRRSPILIALFLIAFGLLLAAADRFGAKRREMARIGLKEALVIGLAQCLALVPGVSRSGITITAALFQGFTREAAARFSFLLSLPIVAGAGILKMAHLAQHGVPAGEGLSLAIGVVTSAVFGYLSVALLLKLVQRHSLAPFVWYRVAAGCAFLVLLTTG